MSTDPDLEMGADPVIEAAAFCLAHAPDLVWMGSKPFRRVAQDPGFADALRANLRGFDAARRYPPNLTFIGRLSPEQLARLPRPWFGDVTTAPDVTPEEVGFGEIIDQRMLYALLHAADVLEPPIVDFPGAHTLAQIEALRAHPVLRPLAARLAQRLDAAGRDRAELTASGATGALPLQIDAEPAGVVRRDDRAEGREDANLDARTLLEGLCAKATASHALMLALQRAGLQPTDVDYIISCGEEACGDRYQRGGGGMAKAVGELCGCEQASGMDVKNFCAGPASALVTAAALVKSGLYARVAVVAGGSLAKLGMKCEAFLAHDMPVLDDCLGSMAVLVGRANAAAVARIRIEPGAVGIARIGASTSDQAVYEQLISRPLQRLGLRMADIDRFAPELHNPEIMEHAGSGDVAHKNYRMIAALGVLSGELSKARMQAFIDRVGMVGFAPTQGHIPSGVPYIGHALRAMAAGELRRVMFVCKASLFLNRLTHLYDGVSFLLEATGRDGRGLEQTHSR
ncbi:MAG: glycine reductase [Gammaproteobacteria bacterium]|nr:glycine reductase [Gammaproteobacteria bacterium]